MTKAFRKWWYALVAFQFVAGTAHALSFLAKPEGKNDTEKQLIDLMMHYREDMGAGFHPSTFELFSALSACYTLMCVLAGWSNLYLLKQHVPMATLRGLAAIQAIIFGVCFVLMSLFTFLPPITLTGLIFLAAVGAYFAAGRR